MITERKKRNTNERKTFNVTPYRLVCFFCFKRVLILSGVDTICSRPLSRVNSSALVTLKTVLEVLSYSSCRVRRRIKFRSCAFPFTASLWATFRTKFVYLWRGWRKDEDRWASARSGGAKAPAVAEKSLTDPRMKVAVPRGELAGDVTGVRNRLGFTERHPVFKGETFNGLEGFLAERWY